MENTSWLKQTPDKPLFEDLVWSRPENKRAQGKLLIVGGNAHGFIHPATAYSAALKARSGTTRVLLPDALQKTLGKSFPEARFAPSTPSGSFARQALATLLDESGWADGTLLAGDFGRNSETSLALESFIDKFQGVLIAAGDALDPFLKDSSIFLERPKTFLISDLGKLQKVAQGHDPEMLVRHSISLISLVELLAGWTTKLEALIVTRHQGHIIVAHKGRVSSTSADKQLGPELAAYIAVWAVQQPAKSFEAATTAIYCSINESPTRAK